MHLDSCKGLRAPSGHSLLFPLSNLEFGLVKIPNITRYNLLNSNLNFKAIEPSLKDTSVISSEPLKIDQFFVRFVGNRRLRQQYSSGQLKAGGVCADFARARAAFGGISTV